MSDHGISQTHSAYPPQRFVARGSKVRQQIIEAAPAFLEPARFSRDEVYHSAVAILIAFALGSQTAAQLMELRQQSDPTWPELSRDQAFGYLDVLHEYHVA